MLLGAIIAGGRSSRFGSDKAVALLDGRPLLEHVADALRAQVDELVVVGRFWPGIAAVPDRPTVGLGPLGGLLGALDHAGQRGFDEVLTASCDCPDLPFDLARLLGAGAGVWAGQPLIGRWPVRLAPALAAHIAGGGRSMHGWIAASGAREVPIDRPLANVNRPADLAALRPPADPRSSR